ncbi:hypothetical protein TNCV_614181 [Trichonephila clavipes]|nr:hypothetical protein TNCV_614181 [Trichonephila clavipes]
MSVIYVYCFQSRLSDEIRNLSCNFVPQSSAKDDTKDYCPNFYTMLIGSLPQINFGVQGETQGVTTPVDDDNVRTASLMADKDILEFVQSSNNTDSDGENEMNKAAPVPTSSEM